MYKDHLVALQRQTHGSDHLQSRRFSTCELVMLHPVPHTNHRVLLEIYVPPVNDC